MPHQPGQMPPEFFWFFFTAYGIFLLLIGLIFAIGFYHIAARMGRT